MSREFKVHTEGMEPLLLPCASCVSGKKQHRVLARVTEDGSEGDSNHSFDWHCKFDLVQCGGCLRVSYRIVTSDSEDYDYDDDNKMSYNEHETLYPPRVEGRQSLGSDVWFLPPQIRAVYDEVLTATANQLPVLAGIGLRALVEAVCKEKQAAGVTLDQRIRWLEDNKILTPSGAKILHHIRNLGNGAAHEIKPHSKEELQLALEVVEHLFKDVYVLPTKARQIFEGKRTLLPFPIDVSQHLPPPDATPDT